ncbi:MAG TPA: putative cytokinetic ring protein SteA [Nocardioides sp.]|uniref:putative cytokinetic ring protein SteA n=1 Tax=Nocardioides sp. TaxID=35761 RepID=UPI002CBE2EF1|nr:putative cytokinetic ring protein SteA [Nocardioides sp.]HQR27279.1 putative cytokinetic ring protein SteA [Nocardioides sp.]
MKMPVRQRPAPELPGLQAVARVDRRTGALLTRLRPGEVAVLDQLDLDRATAAALVEAGVAAVVDAAPMISGRFPNLGPQLLVEAGVPVVDTAGPEALAAIPDGARVRLDGGQVYVGDRLVASGRVLDAEAVQAEMAAARTGMASQLESFVHNSAEFLRREQDLLLHGTGLPTLRTPVAGRPVVVVVPAHDHRAELARVARFAREQQAVLIGVQRGADALLAAGLKPDVIVLDGRAEGVDAPSRKALRAAREVVVRVDHGGSNSAVEAVERLGVRPLRLETSATPEDAALLLADAAGASVLVGVGMHATLVEFLDRQRPGLASTYLTRLTVGPRLVDASAVPQLYSGRVRPWHVLVVLLAGLVALAAAVAVTPVGQQWLHDAEPALRSLLDDLQGLFS